MKHFHIKKNKGITLIVLIITIIILLILAGITVPLIIGNNSIVNKAAETKKNEDQARLEEDVNLKVIAQTRDYADSIESYLDTIEGATIEKLAEGVFYVTRDQGEVTVTDDGEIMSGKLDVWDGESEACPVYKDWNWYIYTASQLKFLANFVNNKNVLTDNQLELVSKAGYNPDDIKMDNTVTVYLMNNLYLGAKEENGEWQTENNEKFNWEPIGISKEIGFLGNFDGNNHIIRNLYINSSNKMIGLFGYLKESNFKNITLKNSYIKGFEFAGGIIGYLDYGNLSNCFNYANVVGEHAIGGVAGCSSFSNIKKCENYGTIIGIVNAGGVVGVCNKGNIENCKNYANVIVQGKEASGSTSSRQEYAGGIVACTYNSTEDDQTHYIKNCENYAYISGAAFVGGIIGWNNCQNSLITNCKNYGNINGQGLYVGGIAGDICQISSLTNCENLGNVTGENKHVGGIVGWSNRACIIDSCINSGTVNGKLGNVGGIVGYTYNNLSVEPNYSAIANCVNIGNVNSSSVYVGGIVGALASYNVIKCYNIGQINVKKDESYTPQEIGGIGGIVGVTFTNTTNNIINCYNAGKIIDELDGSKGVGGILRLGI